MVKGQQIISLEPQPLNPFHRILPVLGVFRGLRV